MGLIVNEKVSWLDETASEAHPTKPSNPLTPYYLMALIDKICIVRSYFFFISILLSFIDTDHLGTESIF
jgi:hypothetical protein